VLIFVFIMLLLALSYQGASLIIFTCILSLFFIITFAFSPMTISLMVWGLIFASIVILLNVSSWRRRFLSKPMLNIYQRIMPTMSRTEREAISAGNITWEGDLFCGKPNWNKLLALPAPCLTAEEQAFIDGPVETLCKMLNDWEITHHLNDLPATVWDYIKKQGFFGLIIPKKYQGKQFSAYAHSQILTKISGRSISTSSIIAVPNSLGPAELLLHYGTEKQKEYYLPRLARGEEIPCFALTSPLAGSDAGAMTDYGIVCYGEYEGKNTLGIRLQFNKRYITLAPVATVIGLAFKLYDPEHLLGGHKEEEKGITCALIPRSTKGLSIGRRHFPLNAVFQNGPIQGKDVFIPIECIIGGVHMAGKGWGMLMQCLAAGRAVSLPASAMGGAKVLAYATGAYARIRKQFNTAIGRFEGVEEALARLAGYTYIMDAARTFVASAIDHGAKPSVASAIVKYHVTELGRKIAIDSMDIHGGKGICLGPLNYIGRGYEAAPIAITVEGANILTRNMIIFGQGAMRCHPYVLAELEAAHETDEQQALIAFDKAVIKHIAFAITNLVRSLVLGLSSGRMIKAPKTKMRRYYQQASRFSAAFAFLADVSMLFMGKHLKRKESISARLGDILSYLYLLSAVLKMHHDQENPQEDIPLVRYACLHCLFEIQESFANILKNFPNRWLGYILNFIIFPLGQHFSKPNDRLQHKISQLLMAPTATRSRLSKGAFINGEESNVLADIQDALLKTIQAEPIEKQIKAAKKQGLIKGHAEEEQAQSALENKIISLGEFDIYMQAIAARNKVIAVDDFSQEELARV
jgi:acyl-CoA dehydrogenase